MQHRATGGAVGTGIACGAVAAAAGVHRGGRLLLLLRAAEVAALMVHPGSSFEHRQAAGDVRDALPRQPQHDGLGHALAAAVDGHHEAEVAYLGLHGACPAAAGGVVHAAAAAGAGALEEDVFGLRTACMA